MVRSTVTQKAAEAVHQRWQEKQELFRAVKHMQAAGMTSERDGRAFRRQPPTAGQMDPGKELPERSRMQPRPGMAESFRDYLWRRWEQGCRHGRTLLAEIRQLGYIGGHSQLAKLLSPWRQPPVVSNPKPTTTAQKESSGADPIAVPGPAISPQVAAALLSKLSSRNEQSSGRNHRKTEAAMPGFCVDAKVGHGFSYDTASRQGVHPAPLDEEGPEDFGIHAIVRFVRTPNSI